MFRSYSMKEMSTNKAKASVSRKIREDILQTYPLLEPVMEQIWPKKAEDRLLMGKTKSKISAILIDDEVIFFQKDNGGVWFPTLRLLHKYPNMMPKMQVDKGAIKFVIKGADVMCPGLTHPTGSAMEDVEAETAVQITAEGKQHACAIGLTTLSTAEIQKATSGVGIAAIHSLGDGLWKEYTMV